MSIRLSHLTASEARLLIRLDDGRPQRKVAGLELDDLSPRMLDECNRLARLGLVEVTDGPDKSVWYRLTERGRAMRKQGWVA